jgi:hypothetical protein
VGSAASVYLLMDNYKDYSNSYTITNIGTTTASLQQIIFPSIFICNVNQVSKSFLGKYFQGCQVPKIKKAKFKNLKKRQIKGQNFNHVSKSFIGKLSNSPGMAKLPNIFCSPSSKL